jgi:tetratricopeptide (TPR) repeat protein
MPQSPTQDIPHVQITDHYIRVVNEVAELSPQEIESRKRFIRLASLVNPEPTDLMLADGLMSYYELITNRPGVLDTAEVYLQRAGRSVSQDELAESYIRLWYLTERYADIRRYVRSNSNIGNSQGWTLFRIGEAFAQSSEYGIALSYLEKAVESAPNFLRFADRLASAYTSAGNTDRAIEIYDQIAQQNPQFEDAIVNRGYARLISGQLDQAEADFQQAIELYPDARVALGNLASLYASTGETEKAIEIVNRLLELDPENVQYQQMSSALRN